MRYMHVHVCFAVMHTYIIILSSFYKDGMFKPVEMLERVIDVRLKHDSVL